MIEKDRKYIKWSIVLIVLTFTLIASALMALSSGELKIGLKKVLELIIGNEDKTSINSMLINQIRLPRVLLGIAVGGALSLSGVILQGIYKNPLVEPYTLGISGGASLGVAFIIVLGLQLKLGEFMLPLAGFVGAALIVFLVYFLSSSKGSVSIERMLLTGVMVSFIASSAMMILMALSDTENLHGIIFWTMGSLDEPNISLIWLTMIVSITGLIFSCFFAKDLNALRLGKEKAMHLGIHTNLVTKTLFFLASLLAGVCVAVAGVIGFVGLIIPHVLRQIVGSDYRILLISSFLLGGSFLVLCDMVARTIISPNELPIGVITGIIGGTIFIIMMNSKKKNK